MCRCCCEMKKYHLCCEFWHIGFPWLAIDIEEEIKMLEEYKEALTKELEKVNKRLATLKQ